jgi:epoxyqueuosine reductase
MKNSTTPGLSKIIKAKTRELGFNICGIAKVRSLDENGPRLRSWIEAGMNDIMGYLARDIDKRLNPCSLFPDAKSVIVTGLSYYSEKMQYDPKAPVLSRYVYGADYHEVIAAKLEQLLRWIKNVRTGTEGKVLVDSSPIMEKAWGREAGLGWQGRHSILINREIGSFFFIGILILNFELDYDTPFSGDYCGKCRICINECPTKAINDNHTIDARKCIANITIERRGPVPEHLIPSLGGRIYGCDRCQEVCPWNNTGSCVTTPEFTLDKEISEMTAEDWKNLSEEAYLRLFGRSAMRRIKYEKLMSNIAAATRSVT